MSGADAPRGAPRAGPGPHAGVVAIDGPAASGKSSVAREVARRLGIPFVSSGALYRAATLLVLDRGADPEDGDAVTVLLGRHRVELAPAADENRVRVDGEDVTARLHTDAVDAAVSAVALHPRVRAWVDERLRELPGPFVVEGRDMGTAVFPGAGAKFYLTASPEVRAARRAGERAADTDEVAAAIRRRDARDAKQLEPAPDAERIATDDLDLAQVVERVLAGIGAR